MKLKTPKFWYINKTPNPLLKCLGVIYNSLSKLYRFLQKSKKNSKPVICIGNITMGGSGKTPTAIAVADILKDLGFLPHFLSRGYGGSLKSSTLVMLNQHDYLETGDEPLLLAKHFPCWVSKNRNQGVLSAIEGGAGSIVMDDGFQNFSVYKDLSLLVIDSNLGFGNGYIFPAGALRETPIDGLKRADACVILNETAENWNNYLKEYGFDNPIFYADIMPKIGFNNENVIGFAGLGIPQKFKNTLQNCGANIVDFIEFADHHPYTDKDIENLLIKAEDKNAILVTTEKDIIRVPVKLRKNIKICPISLQWRDIKSITAFLKEKLTV